jgi:hypothetical protein
MKTILYVQKAALLLTGAVALAVWMSGPAMGSANLLTNGNFESTGTGNINNADMPGWTSELENHTHIDSSAFSDGNYAVLNHNGKNFEITQKFDVVKNTEYVLTYDFGVAKDTTFDDNELLVGVGPRSGPILLEENTMNGPNKGQLWETFSYTFTATKNGLFQVAFAGIGDPSTPHDTAFIDNVSIRAVPEASTLLLFGFLVAGGVLMLRRRQSTAAI